MYWVPDVFILRHRFLEVLKVLWYLHCGPVFPIPSIPPTMVINLAGQGISDGNYYRYGHIFFIYPSFYLVNEVLKQSLEKIT
jgi:hypothetical protein